MDVSAAVNPLPSPVCHLPCVLGVNGEQGIGDPRLLGLVGVSKVEEYGEVVAHDAVDGLIGKLQVVQSCKQQRSSKAVREQSPSLVSEALPQFFLV